MERYRKGDRKTPPKSVVDRIDTAVRARWQPVVRGRRRKQAAASTGITVETRARFGYTAPVGTTDDGEKFGRQRSPSNQLFGSAFVPVTRSRPSRECGLHGRPVE